MRHKLLSFVLLVMVQHAFSQKLELPATSSAQKIEQQLGTSKITVNYARPSVKGRKIFGGLVPYGQVWRTGANKVTDIAFDKPVSLDGHLVPAGKYGLVTVPGKDRWTIILTSQADIWGVYEYDRSKDVLRFDVPVRKAKQAQETLTLSFEDVSPFKATFRMAWEKTLVEFPITIDQDAEIEKAINDAISRGEKPYFRAANFYANNGKDLNKALEWITQAEADYKEAPHYWYWRGKIENGLGRKAEALSSAQKGLDFAEKAKNEEYIRLNKELIKTIK